MPRIGALVCLLLVLLASGCSKPKRVPLTVGSKNFTEQVILGEITAQHLERRLGEKVVRKLNLGGTLLAHQALLSGEIDVYPEYTGTAYTSILKLPLTTDAGIVRERVKDEYAKQFQLAWLPSLGFDNSFVMAVRGEDARSGRLETLTDAADAKFGWKMGVGYEFQQRPDGLAALMKTYHLRLIAAPRSMDLGLLYKALEQKQVNMVAGNATDGLLATMDIQTLRDDKGAFPPYEASLVARQASLAARPAMRAALEELSGKISSETMRKLNLEVDGRHRQVADVAREFLQKSGLE